MLVPPFVLQYGPPNVALSRRPSATGGSAKDGRLQRVVGRGVIGIVTLLKFGLQLVALAVRVASLPRSNLHLYLASGSHIRHLLFSS
jgi:hypothetical protein